MYDSEEESIEFKIREQIARDIESAGSDFFVGSIEVIATRHAAEIARGLRK